MADEPNHAIKGDRALGAGDRDELGFREVAGRIATALIDRASNDGLVVGLEGTWGSGKSSLLYLIGDELAKQQDSKPSIINFRPWLIGNRDALIASLFGDLSKALDQITLDRGDASRDTVAKAKVATTALRKFAAGLSKAGSTLEAAGDYLESNKLKFLGKLFKSGGDLTTIDFAAPQLSNLKDTLSETLRNLGHRFIVTVDDVDRLEPAEVIEILRLVRSVADLPNVIYVLCYDSEILAHSIKVAARVKNGHGYLEKIVQLTVMVPTPEPMQLRQWFTDELHKLASSRNEDERSRLQLVIDYEGGRQLRTARSVVRAMDAMRLFWPPLQKVGIDLADLVWIQLIKNGNPALYRWIEDYCATMALISLGTAQVSKAEKEQQLASLLKAVGERYFDDTVYEQFFEAQLPGIEREFVQAGAKVQIFQPVNEQDRDANIRNGRIGSPDHFRYYFALTGPSHALRQEEYSAVWTAAEASASDAGAMLLQLQEEHATGSLTKADVLLERISSGASEVLTANQRGNLLVAFAEVLDEAFRRYPFDHFWINSLWDRAQRSLPLLLRGLANEARTAVIETMFGEGAAIGWLTSLLRHETFAHGRYHTESRRSEIPLFTVAELDRITALMLDRYRKMSIEAIFATPDPISLLFAWLQAGDAQTPRERIEAHIVTDEGLVETLEHLRGAAVSSARGPFVTLRRDNIEPFMNFDAVYERIHNLKSHPELGDRSKRLATALHNASR